MREGKFFRLFRSGGVLTLGWWQIGEPHLIGRLKRPGVGFQEGVLQGKAGFGPSQEVVAIPQGCRQLGQQPLP